MITGSEILAYISIKFLGDWDKIYDFASSHPQIDYEECKRILSNIPYKFVTMLDKDYPSELKHVYKPPFVLFYLGDLSLLNHIENNLGVVGTRDMTKYGAYYTHTIVKELAKRYTIVSGLALGIDTMAHVACLDAKGKTIAVLPSGIMYPYPRRHAHVYKRIIEEGGLVISEYPDEYVPIEDNFPIRNRIIAGITRALFVPEAHPMSGTLITINMSIELGHAIFCLPSKVYENSLCNILIREGATLVQTADDIIEDFEYENHEIEKNLK